MTAPPLHLPLRGNQRFNLAIIFLIGLFSKAAGNVKKMSLTEAQAYLSTLAGTEEVKQ